MSIRATLARQEQDMQIGLLGAPMNAVRKLNADSRRRGALALEGWPPCCRDNLAQHRCIVFTAPGRSRWAFRTANGEIEHVDVSGVFTSDSQECVLQLALQGAGIARLADFMVARPIRDGKLVPLLADQHHPERTAAYAVFPPGTQKIPKVRVFLDFLIERFRYQPQRPDKR